jgi:hypothetical protein
MKLRERPREQKILAPEERLAVKTAAILAATSAIQSALARPDATKAEIEAAIAAAVEVASKARQRVARCRDEREEGREVHRHVDLLLAAGPRERSCRTQNSGTAFRSRR